LIEAFTAEVRTHSYEGHRFRHRSGALHVPPDLRGIVRAVFGLHEWPRSARHRRIAMPATTSRVPLSAAEVAERYAFPDADGSGQTIGIIQFGGSFKADDFTKCLQGQGLAVPSVLTKRVDDAVATHALEGEFDEELALDVQIAGQLAPGATLVLYAAPHTERGLLDAIRTALFDEVHRPQILSISFGWPEFLWTPVALALLDDLFAAAALLGVSVFCASGDDGVGADYAGGPHVLAPASSPFVHACGGTHINGAGASAETAWEHSGGGFSAHHPVPVWQEVAREEAAAKHARAGRGVPDVSAQVEPGYTVVLDGVTHWAGGTSAVAPMWAALTARINQRLGTSAGFYAPLLYARRESGLFRDVTGGSNGLYDAHPGWSACTGLGVPNGDAILAALSA